jgi:hypothetical protein
VRMHTFIVRVLVADDVDELTGVIEEPLGGDRRAFHGGDELIVILERATGRPPVPGDGVSPRSPGRTSTRASRRTR